MVQFLISIGHPQRRRMFDRSLEYTPVFLDVGKVGREIFRRDEEQFFQRTGLEFFKETGDILRHGTLKLTDDILGAFGQKIPDRFIVQIEGRTVHTGFFTDLLHGDVGKILFLDQFQKSFVHSGGGGKILAFRFVQWWSPFLFQIIFC